MLALPTSPQLADVPAALTCGGLLTAWELLNRQSLDLVLTHLPSARDPFDSAHQWYGLVELAGSSYDVDGRLEAALEAAVEQGLVTDAVVAGSPAQRASLWALREGVSEAQKPRGQRQARLTLPIAALPEFVGDVSARLEECCPGCVW